MSNPNSTPLHKLQEHIASLAPVMQWLGQHPELDDLTMSFPLADRFSMYVPGFEDDSAERFATAVRALKDGAPIGTVRRTDDDNHTRFSRDFGAVTVSIYTYRDAVCERIVVGTETVEVPDPNAPTISVERDVVRWECRPVLAGDQPKVEVPA